MMMLSSWLSITAALTLLDLPASVEGGAFATSSSSQFNPVEDLFKNGGLLSGRKQKMMNATSKPLMMDPFGPTPEEREAERDARRNRQRERKARMKEAMEYIQPDVDKVEKVSEEELNSNPAFRNLNWVTGGSGGQAVEYADPGDDYDMWQQAYRMLGGFIDCDHQKSEGSGDNGNNDDGDVQACSRWMMWASVSLPL